MNTFTTEYKQTRILGCKSMEVLKCAIQKISKKNELLLAGAEVA
jgi:hypothetical protein